MEPVLVGALSAVGAVVSLALWRQLAWLPVGDVEEVEEGEGGVGGEGGKRGDGGDGGIGGAGAAWGAGGAEPWRVRYRGTVRALRWATAGLLFLLGFLTGWTLIFLKATASG